ncbi:hypothetical protein [Novosphingobium sp. KACC 22771]|uniref:hypothetical protein n=1 Tax=Novosphingobium sp. KACC 22771 TaxID=3025670 RepID=UPI00236521A1|nr:hypothetical protein [Novosphingobium sp. KACC 22771]WDF70926.1 hypothetical protein PQ467_08685 [Novosphingobium sp. KACC 22771]
MFATVVDREGRLLGNLHLNRALEAALADWLCVKLNPERTRRFTQVTGTLAKTDPIDAMLLARMAATLQPSIRPARSNPQAQMAELGRPDNKQAAYLAVLALVTREASQCKSESSIRCEHANARQTPSMPALAAAHYNPDLKATDSTGHRNTGFILPSEELVESFCRCFPSKSFARPGI